MMNGLTRKVVDALKPDECTVLDEVLKAAGTAYDDKAATPNIEEIALRPLHYESITYEKMTP